MTSSIDRLTAAVAKSDERLEGIPQNIELPDSYRPAAAYCGLLVIGASVEDITSGGESPTNPDDETVLGV